MMPGKLGAAIAGDLVPVYLSGDRFPTCAAMAGKSLLARACELADAIQLLPDFIGSGLRFSGFLVFHDIPDYWTLTGIALIVGAGLYVFGRSAPAAD
jgi:hypothetical protein